MWLAYVEQKDAFNLTSAVENLYEHFKRLEFDADHESVYGFERFYRFEECTEIAKGYEKAAQVCDLYLQTCDLKTFLVNIKEMGFGAFLDEVKKFAPKELIKEIFEVEDGKL